MKNFITSISIIAVSVLSVILLSMTSQQKTKVIFFGDSITEAGTKPGGYISIIDSLAKENKKAFEFIGAGVSGHKVYDLFLRLDEDVLRHNPDVVFIYVGINDVWHKALAGTGTDADRFENFYQVIIHRLQQKNIHVVLCTPTVIGEKTDFSNPQDGDLNAYAQIVHRLGEKNKVHVADLRSVFLKYNLAHNTGNAAAGILTTDRVHLNKKGNELVALTLWSVLQGMQL